MYSREFVCLKPTNTLGSTPKKIYLTRKANDCAAKSRMYGRRWWNNGSNRMKSGAMSCSSRRCRYLNSSPQHENIASSNAAVRTLFKKTNCENTQHKKTTRTWIADVKHKQKDVENSSKHRIEVLLQITCQRCNEPETKKTIESQQKERKTCNILKEKWLAYCAHTYTVI